MLEDRSAAALDSRSVGATDSALLTRIQDQLAGTRGTGTRTRRCPCCGKPIRTGQLVTRIHGTSVHVRCAGSRAPSRWEGL